VDKSTKKSLVTHLVLSLNFETRPQVRIKQAVFTVKCSSLVINNATSAKFEEVRTIEVINCHYTLKYNAFLMYNNTPSMGRQIETGASNLQLQVHPLCFLA
jgi:hypothetical protein